MMNIMESNCVDRQDNFTIFGIFFTHSGVCLGMQVAVIEFARSVLGWKDADSSEFNPSTSRPVVIEMPEHNTGQMGATMRLGKRKTVFTTKDSLLSKCIATYHNGITLIISMKEGRGVNCEYFMLKYFVLENFTVFNFHS